MQYLVDLVGAGAHIRERDLDSGSISDFEGVPARVGRLDSHTFRLPPCADGSSGPMAVTAEINGPSNTCVGVALGR